MAAAPNGSPRGGDGSPSLPMLSPAIGSSSGAFSVVPLGPSDASGSRSTTTTRPQDRGMRRRHQSVALNSNTSPSLDFSRIAGSPRLQQESWRELARRRMPALGSLAVGVLVGLIFAFAISGSGDSRPGWRGVTSVPTWTRSRSSATHRFAVATPTLEQRLRVFELLATLTGYHTRQCTVGAQKTYRKQVYERYEPLVGYDHSRKSRGALRYLRDAMLKKQQEDEARGIAELADGKHRRSKRDGRAAPPPPKKGQAHKYFFAINLYNSFDVIPDLFSTMFKVSAILGYQNVFVSVYENGSSDQTKALLRIFDSLCRSVGIRVVIRTSLRTRGAFHHRIEYLAEVRNAALAPLQELRDSEGELFDSVIFMNDVLPCTDDLLELIWQSRRQNAGITCGADYIFHQEIGQPVFYDNWVARDINGTALENAPFENIFHHKSSQHRFERHLPVQVQSCWNGIAILDPAPLYMHPQVKFRMARLSEGECSASECGLICNDYWNAGFGRIVMVSRVKLAYDNKVWPIIHPPRRNLTVIRGYSRLGGSPDDPSSDPQDKSWFGPHDRLFRQEESEVMDMLPEPSHVWCWGWDGAGDIEGPDVEPVWEPVKNNTLDPLVVRHDRSFPLSY